MMWALFAVEFACIYSTALNQWKIHDLVRCNGESSNPAAVSANLTEQTCVSSEFCPVKVLVGLENLSTLWNSEVSAIQEDKIYVRQWYFILGHEYTAYSAASSYEFRYLPALRALSISLCLYRAQGSSNADRSFCVATTHLLFNPKAGEVKLAQLSFLLAELHKLATAPATSKTKWVLYVFHVQVKLRPSIGFTAFCHADKSWKAWGQV